MNESGAPTLLPENYSDKVFAILLGLADGATHAREDEEPGATEILNLYLADGLLEALEWANDGVASDEAACLWLAALRGYRFLTGSFPEGAPEPQDRWLDTELAATDFDHPPLPGDPLTLAGLNHADMGLAARPTGPGADSTGVLPRAAVVALLARVPETTTTSLARSAAYLTHDADAAAACVAAALILRSALESGAQAAETWPSLLEGTRGTAATALTQIVSSVSAVLELPATEAYASYFGERVTEEDSETDEEPQTVEPRDPEADAYAVALLAAVYGSDVIGERPASSLDAAISLLHDRWMDLIA
ncbi:ADP-ribosylglycohydrolase family protein [Glutamicibacter endophyticus]